MNISGENLDLYDKNSGFYNDICYPYTNENGTDVTLQDRQKDFAENNRSLCEENCEFKGYDESTGSAQCSCDVKLSASLISEIKIDKSKLYQFMDITQIANFKIMKCIKLLFSKEGIIINIGFYSFFPVIIAYLVSIIIFNIREYKLIVQTIDEIVLAKKGILAPEPKKKKPKLHMFQQYITDKEFEQEDKNIKKELKTKKEKNKIINNYFAKNDDDIIMEELFECPNNNYHIEMNQINFPPKKKFENKKGIQDLTKVKNDKSKTEPESKDTILEDNKIKNNKIKKSKKREIKGLTKERIKN